MSGGGGSQRDWSALAREAGAVPPPKKAQCRCAANWGLARFLRAVAQEVQTSHETWSMCLRRAAKGLCEVDFAVGSASQAVAHVHGVGQAVAGMLDAYWRVNPPPEGADDVAGPPVGGAPSRQVGAAAPGPRAKKARTSSSGGGSADGDAAVMSPGGRKRWVPRYKTANFALLVTLDKLLRQGRATVTKAELIDAAEASQLSAKGIKPKASNTSGAACLGLAGATYTYDGWSGFNKYMVQVPQGHKAPLCFTYGNPLHIRLTDEGRVFAEELHRAAEARGDCTCGLLPPLGAQRAAPEARMQPPAARPGAAAPAANAQPARHTHAAPAAAPRASLGDVDCIIIASSGEEDDDMDDVPVGRARQSHPPPVSRMPPPHMPAAVRPSAAQAPMPPAAAARPARPTGDGEENGQPAAKRARTVGAAVPSGGAGPGVDPAPLGWKPLPQWRLSALSNDDAHDVRLPPLAVDATFGQEYDIVLLVDNREQFAHTAQGGRSAAFDEGMQRLLQRGIMAEPRTLPIGDALWVARHRRFSQREYCLDVIVERKRVDDLESSIKDNRYKKQKFYLKRCGLRRPCYLLEGEPDSVGASGQAWRTKAVKTAMLTTEVMDGFQVLRTPDAHGTFDMYARLTSAMRELYIMRSAPPAAAGRAVMDAAPSFQQFCDAVAAAKAENKSVRALWGRMLTQVYGVGGEVAEAVVWQYPTPSALFDAYARCPSVGAARDLLASIKTSAVKSVGLPLSARIHDWFCSTTPQ